MPLGKLGSTITSGGRLFVRSRFETDNVKAVTEALRVYANTSFMVLLYPPDGHSGEAEQRMATRTAACG